MAAARGLQLFAGQSHQRNYQQILTTLQTAGPQYNTVLLKEESQPRISGLANSSSSAQIGPAEFTRGPLSQSLSKRRGTNKLAQNTAGESALPTARGERVVLGPGRRAQVMAAAAAAARGEKLSPNKLSQGDLLALSDAKGDGK